MFPSSVIRKLALSEEMLAETHNFVGLAAHLEGPIDVDALTDAFDLLLEAHPVLTARLERGADGRHELVADDLMHSGLEVVEVDASQTDNPPPHFDQGESLVHLRLFIRDGQAHPTLYVHHALADGHHMYGLIEELLSFYTDLVTNGRTGPVTAQPAPESIETVLADRGIQKGPRSGIERFMPALFAYDLPPSRRADTGVKPTSPVRVPMVSCRLSESQTHAIVELCRAEKLGLHSVLSAAILIAEWQVRGRLNIPVPFIYTVDLRYFLSPPVSATGCTNPVGLGTYLAEINQKTTVVDLARDIAATFKGGPGRGCDPAVPAALQPAVCRQRTGHARRCVVVRQRFGAPGAHTSGGGRDRHARRVVLRGQRRNRDLLHPDLRRPAQRRVPLARAGAGKVDRGHSCAAVRRRRAARRQRRQLTGP